MLAGIAIAVGVGLISNSRRWHNGHEHGNGLWLLYCGLGASLSCIALGVWLRRRRLRTRGDE